MTYIHTYISALQILKGEAYEQEYIELNKENERKTNHEILPFSFHASNNATQLIPSITELIKNELQNVISEKLQFPNEKEVDDILDSIGTKLKSKKDSEETQNYSAIIKFKPIRFIIVQQKYKTKIFQDDFVECFKMPMNYFDFDSYSQFVKSVCGLFHDLKKLIGFSSMPGSFLTIDDIGLFIDKKILKINALKKLRDSELELYYKQLVLEYVNFYFDPFSLNRISALDLVTSKNFTLFLSLDMNNESDNPYSFSAFANFFNAFSKNVNEDGMIDKEHFKTCKECFFCDAFVDRVFECLQTYDNCLDFTGFLHFFVNYDNSENPTGAKYLFTLFDVDGDNLVGPFDIEFFYKDLTRESQCYEPSLDIFIQELFDKTQAVEMGFTYEQFLESGSCDEIAGILSDYNVYKIYVGHEDSSNN